MSGETEWRTIRKGVVKAPPKEKAPVCCAVGEKGIVTLTIAPVIQVALNWKDGERIEVRAKETDDIVTLQLAKSATGDFTLRAPPANKSHKGEGRRIIALGKCGDIDFMSRRTAGVVHDITAEDHALVLWINVPRVVATDDAPDTDEDAAGDDDDDAPPPAPKAAAKAPIAKPKGAAASIDLPSAAIFALEAAARAWPAKISIDEPPVKVAAAVALVEFGFVNGDVRKHLEIEHLLLPEREDMKANSGKAATAALEALQDAASE